MYIPTITYQVCNGRYVRKIKNIKNKKMIQFKTEIKTESC